MAEPSNSQPKWYAMTSAAVEQQLNVEPAFTDELPTSVESVALSGVAYAAPLKHLRE